MDRKIQDFLLLKTAGVKHSGRTFYEHLVGVHDLLKRDGEPDHVCLGGLFHSIYGTNAFRHQVLPPHERKLVVDLIGKPAEWLAYVFCSCERPRALVEAAIRGEPYYVAERHGGGAIVLSRRDLRDLLAIEVANLIDQGGAKILPQVISAQAELEPTDA